MMVGHLLAQIQLVQLMLMNVQGAGHHALCPRQYRVLTCPDHFNVAHVHQATMVMDSPVWISMNVQLTMVAAL